jgi:antitoxin component of MazEF toxin-antitoxin module
MRKNNIDKWPTDSEVSLPLERKYVRHLGIAPGDECSIHKLPGQQLLIRSRARKGSIDKLVGLLAGKSRTRLTIEEINEAIAQAGAAGGGRNE